MIRTFTLAFLLMMGYGVTAQVAVVHQFIAMEPVDGNTMKYASTLLRALDPEVRLSLEGDRLKVRIDARYTPQEVLDALNNSGTTFAAGPVPERSEPPLPDGFPLRQNTGDASVDDANYDASKRAWIATHQAEYQRMLVTREAPAAPLQKQH